MSVIKQTQTWKGVTVEQRVNTDTGQIEIWTPIKPGAVGVNATAIKLAETYQDGISNKWRVTAPAPYKNLVNTSLKASGQKELTTKDFNEQFYGDAAQRFNNDRAAVLNNNSNYSTKQVAIKNRKGFFDANTPLVVDPTTGRTVSSLGKKTARVVTSQQQQSNSNQTLEEAGFGFDDQYSSRRKAANESGTARGGKAVTYRYPKQVPEGFEYDYIKITAHDYVASGLDAVKTGRGENSYYDADKNLGTPYETVLFPMQPQLSETNAVNWSDDQLNPVQAMLGNAAVTAIEGISDLNLKAIQGAFGNLMDGAKKALEDPATRRAVAAYFAGQAVGANLQGRLTGEVINPNLELLFNGPQLRTFNFNFRLTPRTEDESQEIRKIIRSFKRNMAVQRTTSNIFLRSPRLFKLVYIYKDGGQHPYLNKFKPCAMSNFQVNYTPDGSYATFDKTGSLTAYDLTMSFSEVMPIYSSDFDQNDDNPTDMGF